LLTDEKKNTWYLMKMITLLYFGISMK
jgi:hypothetical protein